MTYRPENCPSLIPCRDVERRLRTAVMQLRQALRPYAERHDQHAPSTEHLYAHATMLATEVLP